MPVCPTVVCLLLVASLSVPAWSPLGTVRAQQPAAAVTMGSLVMMRVNAVSGGQEATATALTHPDPGVRLVAARLVATGGVVALRAQLSDALQQEKNETVAGEQARALMMLGGTQPTDLLDAYIARGAPPTVTVAYALELARHRPQMFVERLPRFVAALGVDRAADLAPAINLVGAQHPTYADAAWRGWLTHAPARVWPAALFRNQLPPSEAVLREAVTSEDPVVRESTVWFIAGWVLMERTVPSVVLEAMNERSDASAWEAFGREIVARKLRGARRTDRSALVASQPFSKQGDLRFIEGSDVLLRSEQRAIEAVLGNRSERAGTSIPTSSDLRSIRTPENLWPGFFGSLAEATGCRPGVWNFGAVRVTYNVDGRSLALGIDRGDLSEPCAGFASAVGHVTLIDPATPLKAGDMQWIIIPEARDFIACADGPPPDLRRSKPGADSDQAPGKMQPPRKVHNVAPRYPSDALARGVKGVVVMEGVLSRIGCLSSAFVARGVDPFLDMAAMQAVLQWRYSPASVNDVPLDIMMTVTVNFTLN